MTKEQRYLVTEYAGTLNDDDLRWLQQRLNERLQGDLADALNFMSHAESMDDVFASLNTAIGVYDMCDKVRDILVKESKKRYSR